MARCPSEEELDRTAVRLVRADRAPGDPGALPAALQDLAPLLLHARGCARCGEILGLLYATERGQATTSKSRAEGAVAVPSAQVLPLIPLTGFQSGAGSSPIAGAWPDARWGATEEYPVAADSRRGRMQGADSGAASLVLTLTTQDQRFVVRIFPNEDGVGATAVLLGSEAAAGKSAAKAAPAGISLRIGEIEYPFDEKGYARLASFPGGRIGLVVG